MTGYRTIASAVALAVVRVGVALDWWSETAPLVAAVEELLLAGIVVFAALKVNRFIGAREQAIKKATATMLTAAQSGSHGPGKRPKRKRR